MDHPNNSTWDKKNETHVMLCWTSTLPLQKNERSLKSFSTHPHVSPSFVWIICDLHSLYSISNIMFGNDFYHLLISAWVWDNLTEKYEMVSLPTPTPPPPLSQCNQFPV